MNRQQRLVANPQANRYEKPGGERKHRDEPAEIIVKIRDQLQHRAGQAPYEQGKARHNRGNAEYINDAVRQARPVKAQESLEKMAKESFSLLISDIVMPEMDGPTMLRELRKRGVKTKVVFVSGYAEDAFEKNLEGQTDFAFLPKPFTLKQLAEAVKEAIG